MQIMLLEDDPVLSKEMEKFFRRKGHYVDRFESGDKALSESHKKSYDIALLDIQVPNVDGKAVCSRLRDSDPKLPILMITAFGELEDKLEAFSKGADDYLVKPFHLDELLARVNALHRRREQPMAKDVLKFGGLAINQDQSTVSLNNQTLDLTPKEFKLLLILAEANGNPVSKQDIASKLWNYHIETNQNTIEVYINFLRNKIDKGNAKKHIHTRVGFGYYLKEE
jgi:DNA-binding response OmpR family regulator